MEGAAVRPPLRVSVSRATTANTPSGPVRCNGSELSGGAEALEGPGHADSQEAREEAKPRNNDHLKGPEVVGGRIAARFHGDPGDHRQDQAAVARGRTCQVARSMGSRPVTRKLIRCA